MSSDAEIALTDIAGKVLHTATITDNIYQIDISGLPAGLYLVRYSDASHRHSIKVSKQ